MSKLSWYWHRLRAMSPLEMALHARKKVRQFSDARHLPDWSTLPLLEASGAFPQLPPAGKAPAELRDALQRDMEEILAGRWKAFGHLDLQVDDPPKWHRDYLVGRDFASLESAFKLNHRALSGGADIKLIWELSRWHALTRLAMAAYVLGDEHAAAKCILWLEDWVKHNPPYRGWNWTSALEAGMRLIQFAWIDGLLSGPAGPARQQSLAALRQAILPAHVWFTWRHKSFGSSANNHLLGELAGCTIAIARWPALARWGASLDVLHRLWENEVLAQFDMDGGNREQASSYHLFSWEFCWQARKALLGSNRRIQGAVQTRLNHAVAFETEVRPENETWDYGDSDNAFVTPFCLGPASSTAEWHKWMKDRVGSPALTYWLEESPTWELARRCFDGGRFVRTGIAIHRDSLWTLRWDLSRLGFLRTAAHGHLDALHVSLWYRGVALIIDPGTGAYYANPALRHWLASRAAHNAPCPSGRELPGRLGPFLWEKNHAPPSFSTQGKKMIGILSLGSQRLRRCIEPLGSGWQVQDDCVKDGRSVEFTVRWQFPPESYLKRLDSRRFLLKRHEVEIQIEVGEGWAEVELVELDASTASPAGATRDFEGIVSPAFRKTARAPFLKLIARPGVEPAAFTTRFIS